jgi:hypothetical protein
MRVTYHTVNVAKLRDGRYVGAIKVDGTITVTTLPSRNRNTAALEGFSLKADLSRTAPNGHVFVPHEKYESRNLCKVCNVFKGFHSGTV